MPKRVIIIAPPGATSTTSTSISAKIPTIRSSLSRPLRFPTLRDGAIRPNWPDACIRRGFPSTRRKN